MAEKQLSEIMSELEENYVDEVELLGKNKTNGNIVKIDGSSIQGGGGGGGDFRDIVYEGGKLKKTIKTTTSDVVDLDGTFAKKTEVDTLSTKVTGIEDKIPTEASSSNKLTDKSYVDNQINQVAARYLSRDVNGNPFETYEQFVSAQSSDGFFYAGASTSPTKNDYALVSSDSEHDNAVTRYWYTGSSWSYQYVVNNTPFTDEEWAAIRSGITAEKVSAIDEKLSTVSHDDTLSGDGTSANPLSVAGGGVAEEASKDDVEKIVTDLT